MEPAIARGTRVTVGPGKPRKGAVAAFITDGGELELHRLVAAGPRGWWAHLGDNQVDPTPGLVHVDRIVGLAETAVRRPRAIDQARALLRFGAAAVRVASQRRRHERTSGSTRR
jgi:hypothetical protein